MRKLMEYRIISGRTVETKRSWLSTGPDYRKPRGTRRAGASSEAKIRANEKSCILKLARTLNCNYQAGDWFLTLKLDKTHYPESGAETPEEKREEEYQAVKRILTKKALPRIRKAYEQETGKKLKAAWVIANWSPKRKHYCRIHAHMVVPADALEAVAEIWTRLAGEDGSVQAEKLSNEGDYTRTAAYMIENVQGRPTGENKYSTTRGMEKPIYTEPVEVSDVEDVQQLPGGIVKDIQHCQDEDGRTVSSYLRQVLPERVKVRGGQIVLPRKPYRRRSA